MPTLDWIGKSAVVNHHREVPTRLLHCDSALSFGDPDAGNLLVQGDNLEALKALLPYYAGRVKCIYIDPPYNTGNEGWIYNDNVSSPELKAWIGAVTGKEAEDLSRHDKRLCMMYPRLRLLREFLRDDGTIWVSIDDNEVHNLRCVMDEIFGKFNFISNVVWQKKYTVANDSKWLSESHDHLLVYAADKEIWRPNRLGRSAEMDGRYRNPDGHKKGPWKATPLYAKRTGSAKEKAFSFTFKNGYIWNSPPGTSPRFPEDTLRRMDADDEIWFGADGKAAPSRKTFLEELKIAAPPTPTVWLHTEVGNNHEAREESKAVNGSDPFPTPKPERLLRRILELATDEGDLVLDSFAGSATTAAVAHKMRRNHLSIEMGEHAATHCAPRLKMVIDGDQGGISRGVEWTGGGGFRHCRLGQAMFDDWGAIREGVSFGDLAAFVFFSDTGSPIPTKASGNSSSLGTFQERAVHLLFAADSLGVASEGAGNVLTLGVLEQLPPHDGPRVVYAEGCTVPAERLAAAGVVFKQVPYQLQAT